MLDGPLEVIQTEEVADDERLVECDGHGCKQVPQHRLHGQGHRDPADAQSGEQRLDLHAEIVERQQEHHGPDHQSGGEQDDVHRAGQHGVERFRSPAPPLHGEPDRVHRPKARLHPETGHDDDREDTFQGRGKSQVAGREIQRHRPEKQAAGALDHSADELCRVRQLTAPGLYPLSAPRANEPLDDGQNGKRDQERDERKHPGAQGVSQKLKLPEDFHALRATVYRREARRGSLGTRAGEACGAYSVPSMPSSLSLRVRVLRPHPSSFAASCR